MAGAITGGDVTCTGVRPRDLEPVLDKLREAGCQLELGTDRVRLIAPDKLQPVDITTLPHPGFPTDMQAQLMALLSLAGGRSVITETIFENRFMHVPELMRLGADVQVDGNRAVVTGVESLKGATVMATDLRASASLVLAGLAATEGQTEVLRLYHLDRGYERLVEKLTALGANVQRLPDDLRGRMMSDLAATA